jgi:hypothetical protein
MLIKILIGVAAIILLFVAFVATRPAEFRVVRKQKVAAEPGAIFEHVNDLHKWRAWSPWEKVDPEMKRTYEGSTEGTGAIYSWVGNKDVGEGKMTIVDSKPDELVRIALEFYKPYEGKSTADLSFVPEGDDTLVTWSMQGQNGFMGKLIGLFMNMDKMIGDQFEKGLAELKVVSESAKEQPSEKEPE